MNRKKFRWNVEKNHNETELERNGMFYFWTGTGTELCILNCSFGGTMELFGQLGTGTRTGTIYFLELYWEHGTLEHVVYVHCACD